MSNMEIKVTSCADCPFAVEQDFTTDFNCEHPLHVLNKPYLGEWIEGPTPEDCPLKQKSITVKLEENATN